MAQPGSRTRDPWLDNAKTVFVVLVVVGHSLVLLPSADLRDRVYDFIYYWHMPAFVLISGYLSRGFKYDRRHLEQLVTMFVVPYIVFSWLMAMWRIHVTHEVTSLDPIWLNPHWPMWYLCAMVIWRLLTPMLRIHPTMILVAVLASLIFGHWNVELFDINRAIGFLPFFTLGLHLPDRGTRLLKHPWARVPALGFFAFLWFWLVPRTDQFWSTSWMFYRESYDRLDVAPDTGIIFQSLLMLVGLGGALSALALLPRRTTFLTAMGAYTMVVYLLHGFPIRWLEEWGYSDHLPVHGIWAIVVTIALAVGWGLLLGWPPLASRLIWLVDPIGSWQKRRRQVS